jgi:hypothetical protein
MINKIESSDFKIKFDGQEHQVDVNVLINSLVHMNSIIQEVNKYLDGGKKIDVNVKALSKGSFLCHIDLVETTFDALKHIFTKENVEIGSEIVASLVGVISIQKFLKGKKPKEVVPQGDKTKIINENGNVFVIENLTYNIYENSPIVKDALAKNFEVLDSDSAITGFEITDKEERPYVVIEKEDFSGMSQRVEKNELGDKTYTERAHVNILRPAFEGNLKWDLYYKGIKITAKMVDATFQTRIDNGEAFAKGDVLEIDLQFNQKFEPSVNTHITKSYQINKIYNHIKREEQKKFDFNN